MVKDVLIINYDPFSFQSRLNVFKNGQQQNIRVHSSIQELADDIVGIAYSQDIYDVKTHAPLAFISEIARAVHEKENNKFSMQKINVEGL